MEETTVTPQVQTEETPQPYLPSWERIDRSRGKKELVLKPLTDVLNVGDQNEALTRAERMLLALMKTMLNVCVDTGTTLRLLACLTICMEKEQRKL